MFALVALGSTLAIGQAPAPSPDRWPFMLAVQGTYPGWLLDGNKLQIYGWVDASFTGSTDRHDQLPMGFNYLANQGDLQQAWVRFERPVDQTSTQPQWGFRTDTIYGTDYRTVARGLADYQLTQDHGQPNEYGYDPVQFYAEGYIPQVARGLDIKFGRFFAQFGYESIDTTQNPFVSRSYNFIYDPFTHTGLLTTLKLTDAWSVQNGIVTGSDVFIDPAASPTYLGSVKWAPPNGPDSVLLAVVVGKGRYDVSRQFHNPEIFDLVFTHKISDRWTYALDALYGFTTNVPGAGFANWWAAVQYLSYEFTSRLNAVSRLEFFDDVQGQRTNYPGLYVVPTVGLNYRPCKTVVLRPEVRLDYNAESRPFEGKHAVGTAAMDVVVRW
jgi:hypothetical protein